MEKGKFRWPEVGGDQNKVQLSHEELALLLGGIDLRQTERRRWYRRGVAEEPAHTYPVNHVVALTLTFNLTERLWQQTRKNGTHNRYFANEAELFGTLTKVFGEMQSHPELICSYLHPFC